MSLHVITRFAAAAAVFGSAVSYVVTDLKGDYKVEFVVQESTYTGTAKATPGGKGEFSGKWEFTSPSTVSMDVTGKTTGDSVTFDGKYVDNGRSCTGSLTGKGAVEKDGNKAAGSLAINDSCGGEITGSFRLWR